MTSAEVGIQPVVSWPREVVAGRSYVIVVDLRLTDPSAPWPYEREEFVVGCMLDGRPACTVRALGDAGVVLHRFGGTYGPARFVADFPADRSDFTGAALWLTLTTEGGLPFYTGKLPIDGTAVPVPGELLPRAERGGPAQRSELSLSISAEQGWRGGDGQFFTDDGAATVTRWYLRLSDGTGQSLARDEIDYPLRDGPLTGHDLRTPPAEISDIVSHLLDGNLLSILGRQPATVRVETPTARLYPTLPLELATFEGSTLASRDVVFTFDWTAGESRPPTPKLSGPLRVLLVYCQPEGVLRAHHAERLALEAVRDRASESGRPVVLRALRYGVTPDMLAKVCAEEPGWDVIHLAGEVTVNGSFLLEQPDGTPFVADPDTLTRLMIGSAARLKLVVIAAVGGLPRYVFPAHELAATVEAQFGVPTVSLRYTLDDAFRRAAFRHLYQALWIDGERLELAAARAARAAASGADDDDTRILGPAALIVHGRNAVGLRLRPPPGPSQETSVMTNNVLGSEPKDLEGRAPLLTRAATALTRDSGVSAVYVIGPPGSGKLACALAVAHSRADDFDRVEYIDSPEDVSDAIWRALSSSSDRMLFVFRSLTARPNVQSGRLQRAITDKMAVTRSRLVMACYEPPPELVELPALELRLPPLTDEAMLLIAHQLEPLRQVVATRNRELRELVPKLAGNSFALAVLSSGFRQGMQPDPALREIREALETGGVDKLLASPIAGRAGRDLLDWMVEYVQWAVRRVPDAARVLGVLMQLEPNDRVVQDFPTNLELVLGQAIDSEYVFTAVRDLSLVYSVPTPGYPDRLMWEVAPGVRAAYPKPPASAGAVAAQMAEHWLTAPESQTAPLSAVFSAAPYLLRLNRASDLVSAIGRVARGNRDSADRIRDLLTRAMAIDNSIQVEVAAASVLCSVEPAGGVQWLRTAASRAMAIGAWAEATEAALEMLLTVDRNEHGDEVSRNAADTAADVADALIETGRTGEAIAFIELVIGKFPHVVDHAPGRDTRFLCRALVTLSKATAQRGDHERALQASGEAVQLYRQMADTVTRYEYELADAMSLHEHNVARSRGR